MSFVMHNREITHYTCSENRQFIKKSIGCKDQMFFLLPFERNLSFYLTTMQQLDLRLKML